LSTAIILAGSLLYVWQHIQVIRMGYRVERLNAESSALIQEEKQLTLKLAQLKSLGRIEEIARGRLRMVTPEPSQIIFLSPERKPKVQTF
jgi:cell division protein FtsL